MPDDLQKTTLISDDNKNSNNLNDSPVITGLSATYS